MAQGDDKMEIEILCKKKKWSTSEGRPFVPENVRLIRACRSIFIWCKHSLAEYEGHCRQEGWQTKSSSEQDYDFVARFCCIDFVVLSLDLVFLPRLLLQWKYVVKVQVT